jgi:hypothetical protein
MSTQDNSKLEPASQGASRDGAMGNGGSAFPEVFTDLVAKGGAYCSDTYSAGGMTLRDYFAAKALPSFIEGYPAENAAKMAYRVANAMIAARAEGGAA